MSERRRFEYGWCCLFLRGRIVVSSSLWTFGLLFGPGHSLDLCFPFEASLFRGPISHVLDA
jgi:hypothetical protein